MKTNDTIILELCLRGHTFFDCWLGKDASGVKGGLHLFLSSMVSIQMFSLGSGALGRKTSFVAQPLARSKGLKKAQKVEKGSKRLQKALEKAVRACPVPPVRSKRLFEPASVPPVRSKRLFETAVRDHYLKVLGSATLCSEATALCSALLRACICTGPH